MSAAEDRSLVAGHAANGPAGVVVAAAGAAGPSPPDAASFTAAAVCMVGYTPSPAPARVRASMLADLREESAQFRALRWVVTVVASMAGLNFLLARVWLMLTKLRIALLNETVLSVPRSPWSPVTSTRTNAQGLACRVADDQIERIAAGHPLTDGGRLLGKGVVMSVPGRVYKRCGCLNPETRRPWGIHCPRLTRTGHGSWYLTVELSTGPTGAWHRLRRGGYRTRTEAQRALTALRQPHPADPRRDLLTTGQWLQHWLATRLRPRPATLRSYHQHLVPHLGGTLLHELCLDDVQTTFAILARTPTRYGRPRAASTLHGIRATLRVALNAAMRRGLIDTNPARYLELPPASRPKAMVWTQARVAHWRTTGEHPTVAVWTVHQTAQFLHHIRRHRLYPLFRLITLVGLRRGEACTLRWCDVDLHHRALVVCRQLQQHDSELALCDTKTAGSVRMIALDRLTVTVLRRHRATIEVDDHLGGFVFTNLRGDPIKPDRLGELFHRMVRDADLPPIRLHDLRHGAVSLSLAAGNDLKIVQTMLGHSSIVLTADSYTSVLPDLAHHAAEATARLILTAAATTSRTIRSGHHGSHHRRPTKRPPRVTVAPQRSTLPSRH